jgi:hypothetical protein
LFILYHSSNLTVSLWGTLSIGCIVPYMPLNLTALHSNSLFLPIHPCRCPANWREIWRRYVLSPKKSTHSPQGVGGLSYPFIWTMSLNYSAALKAAS